MAKYAISDIHGQYNAFMDVLDKAKFDPSVDTLYILGDMIDWGREPIKVVKTIMEWKQKHPNNIFVTLGNHELMMLDAIASMHSLSYYDAYDALLWQSNNGGITLDKFNEESFDVQEEILEFIQNLKLFYIVDNKYFLTHSSPCNPNSAPKSIKAMSNFVWTRVNPRSRPSKLPEGMTLVSGHTITSHWNKSENNYNAIINLSEDVIDIDCGAKGIGILDGDYKLCLLRLDDLKRFYSKAITE